MKKFIVYFHAYAGASYQVEAESEEEAIEQAEELKNLDDCEVYEFDITAPDVDLAE